MGRRASWGHLLFAALRLRFAARQSRYGAQPETAPSRAVARRPAAVKMFPEPMPSDPPPAPPDHIAVIGMACRFPGAPDVGQFWSNLLGGVESIPFLGEDELLAAGVDPELLARPQYVRSPGGMLEGIDLFDAAFFGFEEFEAALLDPQHRLFLECAYESLEHAGHDPEHDDAAVGVFAGVGGPHYLLHNVAAHPETMRKAGALGISLTHEKDFLALRTSYLLDLRGPSIGVQTACSTSLTATHLACQSLLNGECDMALAGGASIAALRPRGYLWNEDSIYSADGHCRAFDEKATGMVGGDGVGVIVLRRLEDALEAGDTVHAVIRGSAVNNDGSGKVGFIAPGVQSQRQVAQEALDLAEVDARSIGYVEAHGTGTPLGDMIEVSALTDAFRAHTEDRGYCGLGSVKPNIGHLNTAAGIAALIKTVLVLEHGEMPPSLNFERPSPQIDFEGSPFRVVTERRVWPEGSGPRRACVHAMAIGGTNAHLVLEQAPAAEPRDVATGPQLLVLSAKTETALRTAETQLAEYLAAHPELELADVAFTLQVGRRALPWRRIVVASNLAEATAHLTADTPGDRNHCERVDRDGATLPIGSTAEQLQSIGRLWLDGAALELESDAAPRRRIPLPTYPFERKRYWIDPDDQADSPPLEGEATAQASGRVRPELVQAFVEPESDVERQVAEIWREVLGLDRVGIHDNFFEVGGRSLSGIRVMTKLRDGLGVELPLRQLFESPTVAGLAQHIEIRRWADSGGESTDDDDREEIEL